MCLEDQVFGVPEEKDREVTITTKGCSRSPTEPDFMTRCLMPFVGSLILGLMVVWSLQKSVQYSETFQNNQHPTARPHRGPLQTVPIRAVGGQHDRDLDGHAIYDPRSLTGTIAHHATPLPDRSTHGHRIAVVVA